MNKHLEARVESFVSSPDDQHSVVAHGEKLILPSGQKAIVDRTAFNRSNSSNAYANGQPLVFFYEKDDSLVEIGKDTYRFAKTDSDTTVENAREPAIYLEPAAQFSNFWYARNTEIGHQKGREYSDNANYWYDPCLTSRGWSCYGPYVTLDPGLYESWWHIETPLYQCPQDDPRDFLLASEDIVCNFGNTVIRSERFLRFRTVCDDYDGKFVGGIGGQFRLYQRIPYVECRCKGRHPSTWLILKYLTIQRIGD